MSEQPEETGRFVGAGFIAAGIVIVALCGSCTAYWVGGFSWSIVTRSYESGLAAIFIPIALVIGGVPTVFGALMMREGLRRRAAPKPPPSAPPPG